MRKAKGPVPKQANPTMKSKILFSDHVFNQAK